MKQRQTYLTLLADVIAAEERLRLARAQLETIPGYEFIRSAEMKAFAFDDLTQLLVEELSDRDCPMSREEILEIFEASGFAFTEKHIDACRPESTEQVDDHVSEMRADYAEVYG